MEILEARSILVFKPFLKANHRMMETLLTVPLNQIRSFHATPWVLLEGQPSWISKIHHGQNPSKMSSSANVADRAGVALMRVKISIRSGEEVMGRTQLPFPMKVPTRMFKLRPNLKTALVPNLSVSRP